MKTIAIIAVVALVLWGCATTEAARTEMLGQARVECQGIGLRAGTPEYIQCVQGGLNGRIAAKKRQNEQVALAIVGGLAGAAIVSANQPHNHAPPPAQPFSCRSSRFGNSIRTRCW